MITGNIIGFEVSSESSKMIYTVDAAKQSNLPEGFNVSTSDEIDRAMQKAFHAWRIFRQMPGTRRAEFLMAIAEGIEALEEILVNRMMAETAYPQARVLTERRRTVAQLRMYADIAAGNEWKDITIDYAIPGRMPAPRPDLRKINMAIGPVIVFAASNFPLAYSTIGGDATSALAAGCPVIIKAHESHLGTNALVAEVIMNAAKSTGMPDGVFSSLIPDGHDTGTALVLHPHTAAVGFTGSLTGGRALFDLGNQRQNPIPVFAEMGSVNPVFLLPDKVSGNIESLAEALVASITLTVGQFCTNPGILVAIDNSDTTTLLDVMSNKLKDVTPATMLNENIAGNYQKGIASMRSEANVKFIFQLNQNSSQKASPVLATVDALSFLKNTQLHHEIFGPFSIVVLCKNLDEMFSAAHSLEGQLTSTIYCSESEYDDAAALTNILVEKAGRIIYNGVPTGVEVCASMTHGGPYPASTDSRFTAVGHHAIRRWLRPITFQDCPAELLPADMIE